MTTKTNHRSTKLVETSHDLPEDTRKQMINLLNTQLADTFDLLARPSKPIGT